MQFNLDQVAVEAVFDVPDNDGVFPHGQMAYLQALGERRPSVFLAFPPKAAGTFLRQAVIEACSGELIRVVHAQGGRDAQPYLPTFLAYYLGGVCAGPLVAHVHMQALPANRSFLDVFGLRPIVMLRSIPDMLVSYRDMLDSDPAALRQGLNVAIPSNWPSLTKEAKGDFLVDMLGPWYASFFSTWLTWAQEVGNKILILQYRDLLAEPAEMLHRILDHSRIASSVSECAAILGDVWLDRSRLRFNHGKEGRGNTELSDRQQARLAGILAHYPVLRDQSGDLLG